MLGSLEIDQTHEEGTYEPHFLGFRWFDQFGVIQEFLNLLFNNVWNSINIRFSGLNLGINLNP